VSEGAGDAAANTESPPGDNGDPASQSWHEWRGYLTTSGLTVVSDPQRSNQSIPSLTRSNFKA